MNSMKFDLIGIIDLYLYPIQVVATSVAVVSFPRFQSKEVWAFNEEFSISDTINIYYLQIKLN